MATRWLVGNPPFAARSRRAWAARGGHVACPASGLVERSQRMSHCMVKHACIVCGGHVVACAGILHECGSSGGCALLCCVVEHAVVRLLSGARHGVLVVVYGVRVVRPWPHGLES